MTAPGRHANDGRRRSHSDGWRAGGAQHGDRDATAPRTAIAVIASETQHGDPVIASESTRDTTVEGETRRTRDDRV